MALNTRARNFETNWRRFEALLRAAQEIPKPKEIEKPPWDPPGIEDEITDVELALSQLSAEQGREATKDWDDARTWREMYRREYAISDKLRQLAQNLDSALEDAEPYDTGAIDSLADMARRLQLDLNI